MVLKNYHVNHPREMSDARKNASNKICVGEEVFGCVNAIHVDRTADNALVFKLM